MRSKDLAFIGKALIIKVENKRIMAIADLHLGYEEMLNEQGVFIPRRMFQDIKDDLNDLFDAISRRNEGVKNKMIDEIVILGDLKHEFGTVNKQEWKETGEILDMLRERCRKIIIIKGNHDRVIEPIAKKKGIGVKDYYISEDIGFLHGDKIYPEVIDKKIKTLVLGHMHPAITLKDKNEKSERYKCFLTGDWKGKKIIILPSFFPLVEGVDVFAEDNKMAFNFDLSSFEVFVVGDRQIYNFGKMKEIK